MGLYYILQFPFPLLQLDNRTHRVALITTKHSYSEAQGLLEKKKVYTHTTIPFDFNTKDIPFQIALVTPVDFDMEFFQVMGH